MKDLLISQRYTLVLIIQGCIMGAFIGDAAGAFLEFKRSVTDFEVEQAMELRGGGPHRIAPGQITDDSEMALCIFHGLLNSKGALNLDNIAGMYFKWILSGPFDIGVTTKTALTPQEKTAEGIFDRVSSYNQTSQSNGCLMRITPLAVWGSQLSNDDLYRAVYLQTYLTHCNQIAIDSTYIYCFAIKLILNGKTDRQTIFEEVLLEAQTRQMSKIVEWLNDSCQSKLPSPTFNQGWLKIAFVYSFHFLLQKNNDLNSCLKQMIMGAGDTDTNAAIVGGLIGSFEELNNLDQKLVRKIMDLRFNGEVYQGIKRPDFLVPGLSLNQKNYNEFFKYLPKKLEVIYMNKLYKEDEINQIMRKFPLVDQEELPKKSLDKWF
ncbi:UNKNOWN [Stylonychia lemnae]|uniref:ADP-ribosylglycohydrolase n=1 Tax=Stylonychia lemnae TaxID=5949 RepID=A0A078BBF5_STYLE|nr:UNKNOWN [Stylonychia lemnae]|eukprot:CDW91870.1 UNKNOWN [Stylonychia lemnae]